MTKDCKDKETYKKYLELIVKQHKKTKKVSL